MSVTETETNVECQEQIYVYNVQVCEDAYREVMRIFGFYYITVGELEAKYDFETSKVREHILKMA